MINDTVVYLSCQELYSLCFQRTEQCSAKEWCVVKRYPKLPSVYILTRYIVSILTLLGGGGVGYLIPPYVSVSSPVTLFCQATGSKRCCPAILPQRKLMDVYGELC